jgi:hypothetical protein
VSEYFAYGARIVTDQPIPELDGTPGGDGRPELRIRFNGPPFEDIDALEWVASLEIRGGEPWMRSARTADGYMVSFPSLADFSLTAAGREIVCRAATIDRTGATLRHLVLDQVIPLALKLQGREALHATAVIANGGACAFVGPPGSGKSTVAAAFLRAGFSTVCDDCLLLSSGESIEAVPAYPGVRLCEDAFAALTGGPGDVSPVASYTAKKRWRPASLSFSPEPRPLTRIYRLMRAHGAMPQATAIEPLSPRDALIELVASAFRIDTSDQAMLAREFQHLDRIARVVPLRRLWLSDDLQSTTAIAAVLADLP